jgi:hypothetical protein
MANITDECRTARETATSAGNLVTSAASDGVDTLVRVVGHLCYRSIVSLETRLFDPSALSICGTCYLEHLKIIRTEWSIRLKHALIDRDSVIDSKVIATLRISIFAYERTEIGRERELSGLSISASAYLQVHISSNVTVIILLSICYYLFNLVSLSLCFFTPSLGRNL